MAVDSAPSDRTDTIVAVSTPSGRGGIGILRLSGPRARVIGEALAGRSLQPRRAHHCLFRDAEGEVLDDGIALAFPAPASFTGEDVVELQGHGSPIVLQQIQRACLAAGARLARPGEFSERAYLNDRIDLAQAEAIADLIDAGSEAAAKGALRSLQGVFSVQVRELMEAVTDLRVFVEAAMDFPDEDVDFLNDGVVANRLDALRTRVGKVRAEAGQGVLLADGITLVLAGPPNAGKSSLMNALARRDTAIVTPVPGTTRDVLRERIDLDGLPVHLVDTAGLRTSTDLVEAEGVRRARLEISRADFLLYLFDASEPFTRPQSVDEITALIGAEPPRNVILVGNKMDLLRSPANAFGQDAMFPLATISALTGEGVAELKDLLKARAGFAAEQESTFTARARHLDALDRTSDSLDQAATTLVAAGSGDLLAEDLKIAHAHLGEIVGVMTADDLLGRIFSSFCIGK